ncbi:MAG: RNA polymerase sigma factor [Planctomycetota bacterium]
MDHDLLRSARRGDLGAAEQLVERHHRMIRALACRLAPHPEDGDDIAQETFLAALRGLERFRGEGSVAAWLRGIVRNQARLAWRRCARDRSVHFDDLAAYIEDLAEEAAAANEHDPARTAALTHCLDQLDPRARRLIELRHLKGLSSLAIGELMGAKPPTVRTTLVRLHARLQECIRRRLQRDAVGLRHG